MEVLRGLGLVKRFGGVAALDGVDIAVREGEFLGIVGPNGSGKTTLINVLSGFVKPDMGRVVLLGRDVTNEPPHKRARLGLARAFQLAQLFHEATVWENALIAAASRNPTSMGEPDVETAKEVLEMFGLWEVRNRRITEISEGHRKLLDIALAMAARPRVMLLDEPTSSVSSSEKVGVMEVVADVLRARKVAAIIVEHDLDIVERFTDRVAVMFAGKIVAEVAPGEVRSVKL